METRKPGLKAGLFILGPLALALAGANYLHGCSHSHSRPAGAFEDTFDISPDNNSIVFSASGRGGRDLFLLSLKNKQVSRLTDSQDYEGTPTFSPDGKSILYTSGVPGDRADHIFLRSLDGASIQQLTNEDYNDTEPAFSPDGKQIVFARNLTYNWGGLGASWGNESVLYSMKRDGSNLRPLTGTNLYVKSPKFIDNGKTIAFSGEAGVHTIKSDGTGKPLTLTRGIFSYDLDTSPNGQKVAFIMNVQAQKYRVFLMNSDGSGRREIDSGEFVRSPVFSSDGKWIYFLATSEPTSGSEAVPSVRIWRVSTKGSKLEEISTR